MQAAYMGPAMAWHNSGSARLSDQQIDELEARVAAHPDDICARGYLIAHSQGHARFLEDHILWMIEHHPEWDGFMLDLSGPADGAVRNAWLDKAGPYQTSGTVLQHAAVFFARREPEFAEELLKRAIQVQPDVPYNVQALGVLYGRWMGNKANVSFADHASNELLSSDSWLLVAGAVDAEGLGVNRLLSAKLGELRATLNGGVVPMQLPSRTPEYNRSGCPDIPLAQR